MYANLRVDLDAASVGWDLLFQYHGRPSGIYAADEYLAGLEAVRGYVTPARLPSSEI